VQSPAVHPIKVRCATPWKGTCPVKTRPLPCTNGNEESFGGWRSPSAAILFVRIPGKITGSCRFASGKMAPAARLLPVVAIYRMAGPGPTRNWAKTQGSPGHQGTKRVWPRVPKSTRGAPVLPRGFLEPAPASRRRINRRGKILHETGTCDIEMRIAPGTILTPMKEDYRGFSAFWIPLCKRTRKREEVCFNIVFIPQ